MVYSGVPREGGGFEGRFYHLLPELTPHPKFRSFDKAKLNFHFRGKYIHNNLRYIYIYIRVSLICKLSETPD
jgi:hypothetical protein